MKLTHPDVHFDIEFGKADSLIPVCCRIAGKMAGDSKGINISAKW